MTSVRIFTNLNDEQLLKLTALSIRQDRSISWLISRAVTLHLDDVTPYEGDADHKVMSRTTPENAERVKAKGGTNWRWVNACVERMLNDG